MRVLYFDCFAGVSGDMVVGALIDLGVEVERIEEAIGRSGLHGYRLTAERVIRSSLAATRFKIEVDVAGQPHRTLKDIRGLIDRAMLPETAAGRAVGIFERLAAAEARAHGVAPESVHFHEVGAVDSIIDVVAASLALDALGIDRCAASPLRVGYGFVETEHGRLPVPAPGTVELLRGIPIYGGDIEGEFVTPTGAAIVAAVCDSYGPMPPLTIEAAGYGAGSRNPKGFPNVLRLVMGEVSEAPSETVVVIETNIDDMSPQGYAVAIDRAFEAGALDVFVTPVQMKKNRPGVLLTVLCEAKDREKLADLILRETTTLGVRYYETKRRVLDRRLETIETEYGAVRIKVALDGERALHFLPEYEDCARLAARAGVTLLEVQSAATAAYRGKLQSKGK